MNIRPTILPVSVLLLALTVAGCSWYDNQTTFFNTYYNAKRIMGEVEDEFLFQDENKRVKPRVLVPPIEGVDTKTENNNSGPPVFLRTFIIERAKLQPVATKVDSILIKGSKILANHPKSNYVEGTLFLMAKSYFYRQEWLPSQQKCIELIERYSEGDYSPDAHLMLAKNYLIQRKMSQGRTMLSKTVDVAWFKDRYDILSEAYRLQAELSLEEGDVDKAVQPYKQAIAQSEDSEQRARWQVDVASLYYRLGKYDMAEQAFAKVFTYIPDPLAEFESLLYRAASLARLGRYQEAERIFMDLEQNRNFDEWSSYLAAERMAMDRLQKGNINDPSVIAQERKADTAFIGRPELMAQAFQKGMELYKQSKYEDALKYFAKAKVVRTPVYDVANKYFTLIKQWEEQHRKINQLALVTNERAEFMDTIRRNRSKEVFSLGRVHEQMGNVDSALAYYRMAADSTTADDQERARYLFSEARIVRQKDPETADSLLEVMAEKYPKSEFARQAQTNLGYTADVVIDDAAELYRSGNSFRLVKDYAYASRQYRNLVQQFPKSDFAPKALYALGWMYEKDIGDKDSALYYYGMLVESYPRSEYAREIRPSLEFALAKRNGVEVSDSLLLRDLDKELYDKAKAGELDPLQQMIKNNQNALQVTGPNGALPNIPGLTPPGADGKPASVNDMLQRQMKGLQQGALPGTMPGMQKDSTGNQQPPVRKP